MYESLSTGLDQDVCPGDIWRLLKNVFKKQVLIVINAILVLCNGSQCNVLKHTG